MTKITTIYSRCIVGELGKDQGKGSGQHLCKFRRVLFSHEKRQTFSTIFQAAAIITTYTTTPKGDEEDDDDDDHDYGHCDDENVDNNNDNDDLSDDNIDANDE